MGDRQRFTDPHATLGLRKELDPLLDRRELLLADAFEAVELALAQGFDELLEVRDAALRPEEVDRLGAETGDLEERKQSGGDAGDELVVIDAAARLHVLLDDL